MAVPVPTATGAAIQAALAAHRRAYPDARWMTPESYHVTLRFLGPVDRSTVAALTTTIDRCAHEAHPYEVALGRGGGTRGRSGAGWLSVTRGGSETTALADRLDALLPSDIRASLGPGRPAPHLTVARRAAAGLVADLREQRLGQLHVSWTADRMVLYRSHTGTRAGSRYEPLAEARLGGVPR